MGKKLGQHFLKNKKVLEKIASLTTNSVSTIIEIGPGHGELTEKLKMQNAKCKIIAIEKDKILAEQLEKKFEKDKNMRVVFGDALKELPKVVSSLTHTTTYIIVGNIPYYITGYLLRTIQELKTKPKKVVCVVQKEVAERATQKQGNMNILSASIGYWANAKITGKIQKKEFSPPPKVDSAILVLETSKNSASENEVKYYEAVHALFKQPRKTIRNNISLYYRTIKKSNIFMEKEALFEELAKKGIDLDARPQNLSVENIKTVSKVLYNKNRQG